MGDVGEDSEDVLRALAHATNASLPTVLVTQGGLRVLDGEAAETLAAIGGFDVRGVIGSGGMGVVYDGYDKTLQRAVAIKVLRRHRHSEAAAARLLREAQALARLSHPNVVTVYEAGIDDGRVFLVLEKVTGNNARLWRAARERDIAAVIDVYRQAGRGLAAAHAAGLVHRDVKPENILVGDDGRVRITDFGLVSGMDDLVLSADEDEGPDAGASPTRTGAVVGTLPYIAPEAHQGGDVGVRADQWSFCVALWEAIEGHRPHAPLAPPELVKAICAGELAETRRVPAALRRVLVRGLDKDPVRRFASLDELLAAVDGATRRKRTSLVAGSVAGIALAGLGVGFAATRGGGSSSGSSGSAIVPEPPPVATLIEQPGACPYMPAIVGDTLVFDDGNGDLWKIPKGGTPVALTTDERIDWRPGRGRRAGEAVYTSQGKDGDRAAFIDVATGKTEPLAIASSSLAVGGGAVFYTRADVSEIRRVHAGVDTVVASLPAGLWPYTIAVNERGDKLAITTAFDRSAPRLCVADVPIASTAVHAATCRDAEDVTPGRAAFAPDGTIYYQTAHGIRRRRGTEDILWLPDVVAYGGIDVAPDGSWLVYSTDRPRAATLTAVGGTKPVLAANFWGAAGAADGSWVYTRVEKGKPDALVVQTRDGTSRVVIPAMGKLSFPAVDATGKHAAVAHEGEKPGIYTVDLYPYPPVRISETSGDSNPVWLHDGRVAFTRWDAAGKPSVMIVDPAKGSDGDAARKPAHPQPRVTGDPLPTGELVLIGIDGHTLYVWNPATGAERSVPLTGITEQILQVSASPDGKTLIVEAGETTLWSVSLDGTSPPHVVMKAPLCATTAKAAFDEAGTVFVPLSGWQGELYRVDLTPSQAGDAPH